MSGLPKAYHIKHAKQNAIQTRKRLWINHDVVNAYDPFEQSILNGQCRPVVALAQTPNYGNNHIRRNPLSWVEVLDQSREIRLVQSAFDCQDADDLVKRGRIKTGTISMFAYAANNRCRLLGSMFRWRMRD